MSNLERAQNLADTGQYEASIARSLIVIAAALKMQVEPKEQAFLPLLNEEEAQRLHDDWCLDPNCSSFQAEGGRRETSTNMVPNHHEWCNDPTCPKPPIEVDQIG